LNFDCEESQKIARRELAKHIPDVLGDKEDRMAQGEQNEQRIYFFLWKGTKNHLYKSDIKITSAAEGKTR
jgi:hypothetical protein